MSSQKRDKSDQSCKCADVKFSGLGGEFGLPKTPQWRDQNEIRRQSDCSTDSMVGAWDVTKGTPDYRRVCALKQAQVSQQKRHEKVILAWDLSNWANATFLLCKAERTTAPSREWRSQQPTGLGPSQAAKSQHHQKAWDDSRGNGWAQHSKALGNSSFGESCPKLASALSQPHAELWWSLKHSIYVVLIRGKILKKKKKSVFPLW